MADPLSKKDNAITIREKVDFLEEKRTYIALMSATIKQATISKFNKRI